MIASNYFSHQIHITLLIAPSELGHEWGRKVATLFDTAIIACHIIFQYISRQVTGS